MLSKQMLGAYTHILAVRGDLKGVKDALNLLKEQSELNVKFCELFLLYKVLEEIV